MTDTTRINVYGAKGGVGVTTLSAAVALRYRALVSGPDRDFVACVRDSSAYSVRDSWPFPPPAYSPRGRKPLFGCPAVTVLPHLRRYQEDETEASIFVTDNSFNGLQAVLRSRDSRVPVAPPTFVVVVERAPNGVIGRQVCVDTLGSGTLWVPYDRNICSACDTGMLGYRETFMQLDAYSEVFDALDAIVFATDTSDGLPPIDESEEM